MSAELPIGTASSVALGPPQAADGSAGASGVRRESVPVAPAAGASAASDATPTILVDHLVKRFGNQTVLDGISFSVRRGETLVVLGRSGTGKSVLLRALIGLLRPDAGRAEVNGVALSQLREPEALRARRRIGYVFQGGALFDSLSVLENVGFPLLQRRVDEAEVRRRVLQRLDLVGLAHAADRFPPQLSGGMQKRVALARAIIDLPEVVLYDEPTSGLDPLTTDVINQIILRLRVGLGVTSIVVTHDIRSAFTIADRIIMLDQGRILASGSPDEIASSTVPWVKHFVEGRALEGETRDLHGLSGRRPAITGARPIAGGSRLLPAIRTRRGNSDG